MSNHALSTAGRFPVRRKRPNRPAVDNASRFVASAEWGPVQKNPAKPASQLAHWAVALAARRGHGKAVVAIAAKNARLAWAMLRTGEDFRMPA